MANIPNAELSAVLDRQLQLARRRIAGMHPFSER